MNKTNQIKSKALDLGFELVGIAPSHPVPDFDRFRWWLDQGFAGTMDYLRRGAEKRGDPEKILPGVRSIICCGMNYFTGAPGIPIARYAHGDDYHELIGEKLRLLEDFIRREIDPSAVTRSYVDTGAILERSYAARAGLGWIGKNTCLLNNGVGSYLLLGEILTTLVLDYDQPALDQCGSCTKCLEACPTGAFPEPYLLDATKCISYLTIEYRGNFTEEQSRSLGDHLYGCDICQEVCPYNDRLETTRESRFLPREGILDLDALDKLTAGDFKNFNHHSAIDRVKWEPWRRNLESVKKNRASLTEGGTPPILAASKQGDTMDAAIQETTGAQPTGSFKPVQLTAKAVEKVQAFRQGNKEAEGKGFRVYVQGGGCSGFQYGFTFDEQRDDDTLFAAGPLTVLVDPMSLPYIQGVTVDYKEDFSGSGFVVENPNASGSCGCGHSFSV